MPPSLDIAPLPRKVPLKRGVQNFTTLAFASMMPGLRKYGVVIALAHQYLFQLDDEVRRSVLGSVGTLISFRVGPEDAVLIGKEFQPTFGVLDLFNLPNRRFYSKLMIDGSPSRHSAGRRSFRANRPLIAFTPVLGIVRCCGEIQECNYR